jgi:hypothetical protein
LTHTSLIQDVNVPNDGILSWSGDGPLNPNVKNGSNSLQSILCLNIKTEWIRYDLNKYVTFGGIFSKYPSQDDIINILPLVEGAMVDHPKQSRGWYFFSECRKTCQNRWYFLVFGKRRSQQVGLSLLWVQYHLLLRKAEFTELIEKYHMALDQWI